MEKPSWLKNDNDKIWKSFTFNISLVIIIFILGLFIGIFFRNTKLVNQKMLTRAQAYFHSMVLTRRWNAEHGGVYVLKKGGIVSSPYLKNPDIQSKDGAVYTKKDPTLMTREISSLAASDNLLRFHTTSLKPLNPKNTPDEFERKALLAFDRGEIRDRYRKELQGGKTIFRYMAPLLTESSCLQCHAEQGYKVGDVRGGINISFEISSIEKELEKSQLIITALIVISLGCLLGIIYIIIHRLIKNITRLQHKIEHLAITDELTGLFNRRYFFARFQEETHAADRYGHPLSCILMDIDFFKKINDAHGHSTGDQVLIKLGELIKEFCRSADTAARYGGEAFALLLTETDSFGAFTVAEKIREAVKKIPFESASGTPFRVHISLGLVTIAPGSEEKKLSTEKILSLAEESLYQAKKAGRDCTVVHGRGEGS